MSWGASCETQGTPEGKKPLIVLFWSRRYPSSMLSFLTITSYNHVPAVTRCRCRSCWPFFFSPVLFFRSFNLIIYTSVIRIYAKIHSTLYPRISHPSILHSPYVNYFMKRSWCFYLLLKGDWLGTCLLSHWYNRMTDSRWRPTNNTKNHQSNWFNLYSIHVDACRHDKNMYKIFLRQRFLWAVPSIRIPKEYV